MKFAIVAAAIAGTSVAQAAVRPIAVTYTTTAATTAVASQASMVRDEQRAGTYYYVPATPQSVSSAAINSPLSAAATVTSRLTFQGNESFTLTSRVSATTAGMLVPGQLMYASAGGGADVNYQFVLDGAYKYKFTDALTSLVRNGNLSFTLRDLDHLANGPIVNSFGGSARPSFSGTLAAGRYGVYVSHQSFATMSGNQSPTSGFIAENRFDFSLRAAVPEPASWGLLITGFGLIGATARRRYPRAATM